MTMSAPLSPSMSLNVAGCRPTPTSYGEGDWFAKVPVPLLISTYTGPSGKFATTISARLSPVRSATEVGHSGGGNECANTGAKSPAAYLRHTPLPSHQPLVPHDATPSPAHSSSGSRPLATGSQIPSTP